METTQPDVSAESSESYPRPRRIALSKVAAGLLFGSLLLGSALQATGAAGAAVVAPKVALRSAQVVALNGLVAHRLNTIRGSLGLATGVATTEFSSEVGQAVALNEDPPFAPATDGVVGEDGLWGIVPGVSGANRSAALEIVNGWVYHDGWEGSVAATWNADCTSAHAAGCDGHRRNVLTKSPAAGAKLYIDVTTRSVTFDGAPALAVAALFVWKTGSATA
jgi:hypothetical protein